MLFTYLFWCYKLGFQQKLALPALQLSIFILFFHTQFQFKLLRSQKNLNTIFFYLVPTLYLTTSVFLPRPPSFHHHTTNKKHCRVLVELILRVVPSDFCHDKSTCCYSQNVGHDNVTDPTPTCMRISIPVLVERTYFKPTLSVIFRLDALFSVHIDYHWEQNSSTSIYQYYSSSIYQYPTFFECMVSTIDCSSSSILRVIPVQGWHFAKYAYKNYNHAQK